MARGSLTHLRKWKVCGLQKKKKKREIIRHEDTEVYRDSSYPFNVSLPAFYALKGQNMACLVQNKVLNGCFLTEQDVYSIISLLSVLRLWKCEGCLVPDSAAYFTCHFLCNCRNPVISLFTYSSFLASIQCSKPCSCHTPGHGIEKVLLLRKFNDEKGNHESLDNSPKWHLY